MTPRQSELKDTHTPPRQIRIGWEDWRDFKHAAKAAGADRAAPVRQFIAWYLRRRGATLPDRPLVEEWVDAARADDSKPPKSTARQMRIGNEWLDFEHAAEAAGVDRAAPVRQFIAWYLRRPKATLPERPPLDAWADKAPRQDDWHDFEYATKSMGLSRTEAVNAYIAWYLHRPAAPAPRRPALDAWVDEAAAAARERAEPANGGKGAVKKKTA